MGRQDFETETLIPTGGFFDEPTHTLKAEGFDGSEDGTGRGTSLVPVTIQEDSANSCAMGGNGDAKAAIKTDRASDAAGFTVQQGGTVVAYQCQGSNVGEMGTLRAGNGNETGGVPFIVEKQNAHFQVQQVQTKNDRETGSQQNCEGDGIKYPMREMRPVAYRTAGDGAIYSEGDRISPLTTGTDKSANIIAFDTTQITSKENRSNPSAGDPCHPLASQGHAPAVAFQTRIARNGRGQPKEITDALTSCEGGTHADSKPHVAGAFGVRRLMPLECERLQGFPDNFTAITFKGKPAADGPRYKALGNSMAVPVMAWIGRRIQLVEGIK